MTELLIDDEDRSGIVVTIRPNMDDQQDWKKNKIAAFERRKDARSIEVTEKWLENHELDHENERQKASYSL